MISTSSEQIEDVSHCEMNADGNLTQGRPLGDAQDVAPAATPKILRDEKGRVLPGSASPNPNGRPKGSLSPATRMRNKLATHGEELLELALEQVRGGRNAALLSDLLKFIIAQHRSEIAPVDLPEAAAAGTYDQRLEAINQAVLRGEVSADVAKTIIDGFKAGEEAKRLQLLSGEIEALKAKIIDGRGLVKRIA